MTDSPGATGARTPPGAHPPLGFLFDPNRCTGCAACSLACSTENDLEWGRSWRQIVQFNPQHAPDVPSFHLSLACNHCTDAPCVAHCPTGAMQRDILTGAVLVDEGRCIGCRYCAWVCPYDAPRFDEKRGVMTKCTLCNHRLHAGRGPACVEACPTDALGYGRLAGAARIPGFPDTPAGPRIAFEPLRRDSLPPESTWTLPAEVLSAYRAGGSPGSTAAAPPSRAAPRPWGPNAVSFRDETPLWLFTSGAAALVGWVLAAVLGGVPLGAVGFGAAAGATLVISTLHLARPAQAWRALVNVRTSHLSREIAGYGAFLAATAAWLLLGRGVSAGVLPLLGPLAAALGVLALFLVDRVYDPVRTPGGRPVHAGDTLLMGLLVAAALQQAVLPFLVLAAVKAGLYARATRSRRGSRGGGHHGAGAPLALARVAGLAGPPALWILVPGAWAGWTLALVAAGALADRAQLYLEVRIPTPAIRALDDAGAWRS